MLWLWLLACSGEGNQPATGHEAKPERSEIVIKGSDSEVNVVQRLAEEFMKVHPEVVISVTGGGSGTGIAALIDGSCTLANSSRALKGDEKVRALEKKVDPKAFSFATDAVALVVNPANPLSQLDLDQAGRIFRGEVTDWKDVGGAPGPISLYGRQSNSGTYDYFKSTVVKGEFSGSVKEMNGNAQIVEGVSGDLGAVGYSAAGYVLDKPGVKVLSLLVDGQAVSPADEAAVLSGRYPLARPLYQFMNGKPSGALADFLRYEASDAGQAIVKEMGFYPVFVDIKAENQALVDG